MFQNPYQRCLYDLAKLPDGAVWLGSFSGEAEQHYVHCIGIGQIRGPAMRYDKFKISQGDQGYTPAVAQRCEDYFLAHRVLMYRRQ